MSDKEKIIRWVLVWIMFLTVLIYPYIIQKHLAGFSAIFALLLGGYGLAPKNKILVGVLLFTIPIVMNFWLHVDFKKCLIGIAGGVMGLIVIYGIEKNERP